MTRHGGEMLWGVLFGAMAVNGFAAEDIFSFKVGRFEVFMLVETRRQGNPSILVGAEAAQISRYIPGGTYASEINTFLVRSADHLVVVDTGFGGAIFEGMKKLGLDPGQVDAVLITHLHGDHIGGLQRDGKPLFPKATVYLAQQERDYWTKTNVNAGAAAALGAYGSRVETFQPGELGTALGAILPGIFPVAAFGHTPGHTLYLIEDGGKQLLLWGDLMHVQDIQFPLPGVAVTYDTDSQAAVALRRKVLDYAAATGALIGGAHLVYPAVGTVTIESPGCRFTPAR